jgi:hypothetical protein
MPRHARYFIALPLLLVLAVPAHAQGPARQDVKREKKEEKREEKEAKKEEKELRKIDERERKILRDYFMTHRVEVRRLPPGMLVIGRPLPPGIRKRYLPRPVLAQLPVYPGYSRYMVGGNVVLVDRSGTVVDIAVDIFK